MTPDRPFGRIGEGAATHEFMRGYSYLRLLQAYTMGSISITDLQHAYRELFLHGPDEEKPDLEEELGRILHHMFSVLESFTTDRKVVAEDPEYFLTEAQVRQEAIVTLQKLRILNRA
jgi:hypothetical protein